MKDLFFVFFLNVGVVVLFVGFVVLAYTLTEAGNADCLVEDSNREAIKEAVSVLRSLHQVIILVYFD